MKGLLRWQRLAALLERRRELLLDGLHLFVLAGFAVAQPLYDLLGRNAEFFVAHRSQPVDLLLLVLALSFALPLLLVLLEGAAGLPGRLPRKVVHIFLVGLLMGVMALPPLKKIDDVPGTALLLLAALLGALFAAGYARFQPVRLFLTALSPAIVLFPALFLLASPVAKLMRPVRAVAAPALGIQAAPPIVMVVFDEFSSVYLMNEKGEIDADRYPNFAALARDSYWFRNATTVSDETSKAVPALATGRYPAMNDLLPTVSEYPNNIFTLLGGAYELNVYEPITALCPDELCQAGEGVEATGNRLALSTDTSVIFLNIILPEGMFAWLPPVSQTWGGFVADPKRFVETGWLQEVATAVEGDRNQVFRQFVNTVQPSEKPSLNFLHIMLPHIPYTYLPSGKVYPPAPLRGYLGDARNQWGNDEWAVLAAQQRYLLQLQYLDKLVGELTHALKERDLYDSSLLVITADHGVSFRANDSRRNLTGTNFAEIACVPLFIKVPGQKTGSVSDRNVELVDLLATIADVLGFSIPWKTDGVSVLDETRDRERKVIVHAINADPANRTRVEFESKKVQEHLALRELMGRFAGGADPYGLYKVGPYGQLVGRHVSSFSEIIESEVRVAIDQALQFERIDRNSDFLPAFLSGRLESSSPLQGPLDLAIAVNGTISAVTKTFPRGADRLSFETMLPESAFLSGENEVAVFIVTREHDEHPRLRKAKDNSASARYQLAFSPRGTLALSSPRGVALPVVDGAVQGWTDHVVSQSRMLTLAGWSVDAKNRLPAQRIAVFAGEHHLYTSAPSESRLGCVRLFRSEASRECGFRISLSLDSLRGLEDKEIRLFALSHDGRATEMRYNEENRAILEGTLGIAAGYRLMREDGTEYIGKSDGKRLPVQKVVLRSHAERAVVERNRLVVEGWVVDEGNRAVPERLVVFANGQLVCAPGVWVSRPGVVKVMGGDRRFERSGFRFQLPLEKLGELQKLDLRIFALLKNGVASELAYGREYKYRRQAQTPAKATEPAEVPDPATYALIEDRGRVVGLARNDGRRFLMREGLLRSHAEFTKVEGADLVVTGWVVDLQHGTAPTRLIVFANGKFVHSGQVRLVREDVARSLGGKPAFVRSGFQYRLPLSKLGDLDALDLRIFALTTTGAAGELAYGEGYKHRKRTQP